MTVLLALVTVLSWGLWIPMAQFHPGVHQGVRILYATVANAIFAGAALLAGGSHLQLGWRGFWLPLAGGVVWTAGNYSAFRATEATGLARAAGTWTPLNIVVAFVWGAALFGELDNFGPVRAAVLASALVVVLAGVLMIVRSQGSAGTEAVAAGTSAAGHGLWWACAAGVLWGSYFVPAQWAAVPASAANFPLALGILLSGSALGLRSGAPLRLGRRVTATQLAAGALFGVGNLTLLSLVARVGTGVGFTIAQLSLLVNASVGIWVFHVPKPGTRQARTALAGVLVAGVGGCVIGAMH